MARIVPVNPEGPQRPSDNRRARLDVRDGLRWERDRGLEPLLEAWKATVLPLHQSRMARATEPVPLNSRARARARQGHRCLMAATGTVALAASGLGRARTGHHS